MLLLAIALNLTLLPGLVLTLIYWLFPGEIVRVVFGDAYTDPGPLLALVGLATTLYAGVNIWVNFALSLERRSTIGLMAAIVVAQIAAMVMFHDRLETIALIMVAAGLLGNLAGAATTLRASPGPAARTDAVNY